MKRLTTMDISTLFTWMPEMTSRECPWTLRPFGPKLKFGGILGGACLRDSGG